MQKDDRYVLRYAAVVCIVCGVLLASASVGLRAKQEESARIDRNFHILKAFGYPVTDSKGRRISADVVKRVFESHIRPMVLDAETGNPIPGLTIESLKPAEIDAKKRLPLYVWVEEGQPIKYAFPISGKGLWSTIYGYLALDRDLATIVGITFYRHGETPGLGGEIEQDWFQQQFRGKRVFRDGHLLPFEVVKGRVSDRYPGGNDHAVDGISGATMTGKGLTQFLNEDLKRYEKYFSKIRRS